MTAGAFPDNPFTPGFGELPPFLAGRDREKDTLGSMLRVLERGKCASRAALLHGPKGNGKTVLIGWLQSEAGGGVNVRIIAPESPADRDAVATDLLGSNRDESREETTQGSISAGMPGIIGGEGGRQVTRRQSVSFSMRDAMMRAARDKPLLMIMDEAHTADPAGMGVLLKAFQDSARMAPMRLVLAGTPDVLDVLSAADATFADRMEQLPIGLLTPDAGRTAIAEPFTAHGIAVDDGVVERLAAWADNYPYFLQLAGKAAWTESANFGRMTSEAGEAAIERAREPRDRYYSRRYKELAAAGTSVDFPWFRALFRGRAWYGVASFPFRHSFFAVRFFRLTR